MGSRYLDGKRLKTAILAGSKKVISSQDELNKINVFPVPDGDTGSNMASTFKSISEGAAQHDSPELKELTETVADSALNGARGNSGAILAQFFSTLSENLSKHAKVGMEQFSDAVHKASAATRKAIANPVEGTIITVMHDWANWIKNHWHNHNNFEELICRSLDAAKQSLHDTPNKLQALKKAKVVDAGAQGFVHFLQGITDFVSNRRKEYSALQDFKQSFKRKREPLTSAAVMPASNDDSGLQHSAHATHEGDIEYQYCTECILHGEHLNRDSLRDELSLWGDSLVVVGNAHKIKVHIHTNDPERVFDRINEFGEILSTKAEDMWAQYRACIGWHNNKAITLITDTTCSLPQEIFAKYNIVQIPLQVVINDETFLDRINITHDRFLTALSDVNNNVASSQPIPGDIKTAYEKAKRHSKSAIAITLSGGLSGTYQAAKNLAGKTDNFAIDVIDSKNIACGLGLIVKEAAEAIHQHLEPSNIRALITKAIHNTRLFTSPATVKYMIKGGRVSKNQGRFATLLRLLPVVGLDANGKSKKLAMTFGKRLNRKKTLKLAMEYAKQFKNPQFLIAHAGALADAERLQKILQDTFHTEVSIVPASPLIVTHSGPGTVAIAVLGKN